MKVHMLIAITAPQNKHWCMLQSKSTNILDNVKFPYLIVLLDFSKAFDSLNHNLLLNKLIQLNMNITWFESFCKK